MSMDKVDIIIFGASGYTGKCVVKEFIGLNENQFKWAIAGRDSKKLQEVLNWASLRTGEDVSNVPIITANINDERSLNTMAGRSKLIINCVGPYRIYGEPVVSACIENGAHYVDVTGEPEYMESVQLKYNEAAKEKEVYVVSACGFDSVPADLGVLHLIKNFGGVVNSVESYLAFSSKISEPSGNIGTWETIVRTAAVGTSNLKDIRVQLFATLNKLKLEPRLKPRPIVHRSPLFDNKLSVWFPGCDKTVVLRTQQSLYTHYQKRPVQYRPYFICPFPLIVGLMIVGLFIVTLSKFSLGRTLLLRYPEFFSLGVMSRKGPSEEARARTFCKFRFQGLGWSEHIANKFQNREEINVPPNKKMVTELSFSDPGYGFTAKAVVLSAVTILKETDLMPSKGGVYTPGAAFIRTNFLNNLSKIGAVFQILSSE